MKKFALFFLFAILGLTKSFGQVNPNNTYVNGYYKSNGTYVQGHYRTTPNSTINDNYSTHPNYNPYTGKQGTIQPSYSAPTYSYPSYSTPKNSNSSYSTPTYTYPSYSTPKNSNSSFSTPTYSYPSYNSYYKTYK